VPPDPPPWGEGRCSQIVTQQRLAVTDALYAPLAGRQVLRARQADVEAARNDSALAVAEAYFAVQQARGEVAGSLAAAARAEDLVRRADQLAPGLVPTVEVSRARTELARRRQAVEAAYERWQVASADLARLLRLDPTAVVEPEEEPHLRVELVNLDCPVDDLIPIGLTHRPELAAQQALVQATLVRLRQEKVRPLVPSVVLRGTASATPGLSSGYFGGGVNDFVGNFGGRNSMDLQAVWEFQNLGAGNRALVRERQAENRLALAELMRAQDRVAAEVAQALARAKRAANRVREAEEGVRQALDTADKNLQGLGQTRRVGEQVVLLFRPQEAVAAVAALDQAYRDYYAAVADGNRGHFALYRALGHPARCLLHAVPPPADMMPR
jgi:outer membrane protein TolC